MPSYLFNHIALAVKDVNESVAFYQKVFQLEEIPNSASESKTRWLVFEDGNQLHLIPRPDSEIKIIKAVHFALATSEFDAAVKRLEELQIPYSDWKGLTNKVYIRNDGIRQVYFQDPNGYWIEINDDISSS